MASIRSFEDIVAWQKARRLVGRVYGVSEAGGLSRDFGLKDQLRRAAVSVMANIAEGFERNGDAEFRHFLAIAKGSCGEVRSLLYVASDAGFISAEEHKELDSLCKDVSGLVALLRNSIKERGERAQA